jgi:hypothetical protein
VTGGTYHDFVTAERWIRMILPASEPVETGGYAQLSSDVGLLVTYTCDRIPGEDDTVRLERWLSDGGRWLALHGTNANPTTSGGMRRPEDERPRFFELLGSVFDGHPEIQPFDVRGTDRIGLRLRDYRAHDEPYRIRMLAEAEVLQWDVETAPEPIPIAYLRRVGAGLVAYHALGHTAAERSAGPGDDRSWAIPEFRADLADLIAMLRDGAP